MCAKLLRKHLFISCLHSKTLAKVVVNRRLNALDEKFKEYTSLVQLLAEEDGTVDDDLESAVYYD